MNPETQELVLSLTWLIWFPWVIGAICGKWLTDRRWRGNASQIMRLCSGNRLYKVRDVTPFGDQPASGDEAEDELADAERACLEAQNERDELQDRLDAREPPPRPRKYA